MHAKTKIKARREEQIIEEPIEAPIEDIETPIEAEQQADTQIDGLIEFDDDTLYPDDNELLPRDVEYELTRRWQKNGDERARSRIILAYRRLAVSCAQKAARNGLPFDDLFQEANIGMMQALDRFDPSMGNGFSTFARYHIINRLQIFALSAIAPFRIFNTAATKTLLAKFNSHKKRIEARTGQQLGEEGREEICKILGVDREQLRRYEHAISGTVPLDTGAGNSPDDQTRAIELPSGPVDGNSDGSVVSRIAKQQIHTILQQALDALPERDRKIVVSRYIKEPAKTLDALSKSLGISRERVRQIEIKAVQALETYMKARGIDSIGEIFTSAD